MGEVERDSAGAAGINPYAAPTLDIEDHEPSAAGAAERSEYYVVALQKFYFLSALTIGFYNLYWFYAQFRGQKLSGMKTNPALSAIFSLFTAHRLFKRLDRAAMRAGVTSSPRAIKQAGPYVALTILGQVLRVIGEHSQALVAFSLLAFVATALPLGSVQKLVNRMAGDPKGRSNAKLSPLNIVAIAIAATFWLFVIVGLTIAPGI